MRWQTFGERTVYDSPWVRVALVDVEVPGVGRLDHHVVRMPAHAAGTVVHDPGRGVLLLWRHRFITDTWGWEVPAGRLEGDETAAEAAARETLEETGWRPGPLRPLVEYHPTNGSSDQTFHVFLADGATYVGEPADAFESERIAWVPLDEVRRLVLDGGIGDGLSLTGLLRFLLDRP
ncbi:NUDIX domain-containing protein [Cellulomonas cellasea]|uniref:8-oxo-dGTP pyrophosphatase MutT (NUDIX family) n=1 Tax=Cellulomonas cellasea TaxID=43670 RepID=A0A7W4UIZ7_9CELL|nr:NUDIX domain-containing protein [Cellulomonas cellasea]MBB2925051.1 8-oxo-dGTP pyrophosphatase MutT (NUDIX family) [Cellulomonas cellasea]